MVGGAELVDGTEAGTTIGGTKLLATGVDELWDCFG